MRKSPPPHPELVQAQRFFARVRAFDLECPHCGLVYKIRVSTNPNVWNPRTAVFQCLDRRRGGCERKYIIGLLAWPKGTGHGSNTPPADQVPGPRQLAQMHDGKTAWWLPDDYKHAGRPDPTNLTGEPDRPEEEDPIDLDLAITEETEHPRCLECGNAYNPLKSQAAHPQSYCSQTCEASDR